MRAALLVFGILLGVGGVLLYQWMKPPADDPYFFLTPKPTIINDVYYEIEKPFALYKKDETVEFTFWNVPQPTPKLFYLFPVSMPSPYVMIRMKKNSNADEDIFRKGIFKRDPNIKRVDGAPVLQVTISKIDNNLNEIIIFKKAISNLERGYRSLDGHFYPIKDLGQDYGQYRVMVKALSDISELSQGLDFSVYIRQRTIK